MMGKCLKIISYKKPICKTMFYKLIKIHNLKIRF